MYCLDEFQFTEFHLATLMLQLYQNFLLARFGTLGGKAGRSKRPFARWTRTGFWQAQAGARRARDRSPIRCAAAWRGRSDRSSARGSERGERGALRLRRRRRHAMVVELPSAAAASDSRSAADRASCLLPLAHALLLLEPRGVCLLHGIPNHRRRVRAPRLSGQRSSRALEAAMRRHVFGGRPLSVQHVPVQLRDCRCLEEVRRTRRGSCPKTSRLLDRRARPRAREIANQDCSTIAARPGARTITALSI